VPVLLALGIGVMKTQNEVKDKAAREEARREGREYEKVVADNALEGFGIVTLASLMPVLYLYTRYLCTIFICTILCSFVIYYY
jgi:hypothetical protein